MKSIINIDWNEVALLMEQGDYTILTQLRDASERMRKLSQDDFARRQEAKRQLHISNLKVMKPYSRVYYIGNQIDFVGAWGSKVKDGRDYMKVSILRRGISIPEQWNIPYRDADYDDVAIVDAAKMVWYIEQEKLFTVKSIGLSMDQIKQYNLPPNPAKITDPRAKDYIRKYGQKSWEVDALPPNRLTALVESALNELVDAKAFNSQIKKELEHKKQLKKWASSVE